MVSFALCDFDQSLRTNTGNENDTILVATIPLRSQACRERDLCSGVDPTGHSSLLDAQGRARTYHCFLRSSKSNNPTCKKAVCQLQEMPRLSMREEERNRSTNALQKFPFFISVSGRESLLVRTWG